MRRKFYITTAIDYVNDLPHLGTAYEKVCADIIARHMRLKGLDTFFSMGNDEHSQNVLKAAVGKGLPTERYCDQMAAAFEDTWKRLGISYDGFIRTTERRHTRAVEEIFRRIDARGDVYKSKYAGWYCVSCEGFLQEEDLVEGKCPAHKTAPEWIEEENLFFALSKYGDRLLKHIEAHPEFIRPETRMNEITSFVRKGLNDVSVSRSGATWGIRVPGHGSHVFYVWFDALVNYLTAIGFPDDPDRVSQYWPADVHVIGKDITRFHCILWPAMLMSAGLELPETVFGHGFISFRGERLSKSLGNIVDPLDVAGKYGADSLRYYVAREMIFGKDGDFSWEQFIQRYNSELANDLGNLLSRATSMVKQYFGGSLPGPGEREASDGRMQDVIERARTRHFEAMDRMEIHGGISEVFAVVRAANKYIEEKAPWALMKQAEGRRRAGAVLGDVCEVLRQTAVLLFPFMPVKSQEIWGALGLGGLIGRETYDRALGWRDSWEGVLGGVGAASLFPRIEVERESVSAGSSSQVASAGARADIGKGNADKSDSGADEPLDITEFKRLDLRIAHVKSATTVQGATKLLKLFIDIGGEERQIVAGIAAHYSPESLVGKNIVVVTNLKPAKIRGIESNGMLLAATDGDKVIVLVPDRPAAPGSKIS